MIDVSAVFEKDVLSTGELANACHMTKHTIISAIGKGDLRAIRTPGGHNRIRREDALRFMEQHNLLASLLKTVLVLDDEGFIADLIEQGVEEYGCRVERTKGVYDAGKLIERLKPSVIVLDGEEAGESLAAIEIHVSERGYGKSAKILVVGGDTPLPGSAGSDTTWERLPKPFAFERLQEHLDDFLRG